MAMAGSICNYCEINMHQNMMLTYCYVRNVTKTMKTQMATSLHKDLRARDKGEDLSSFRNFVRICRKLGLFPSDREANMDFCEFEDKIEYIYIC